MKTLLCKLHSIPLLEVDAEMGETPSSSKYRLLEGILKKYNFRHPYIDWGTPIKDILCPIGNHIVEKVYWK